MSPYYIGIEIGGTKIQIVAGDKSAAILKRRRLTVDRARGAAGIHSQIEGALKAFLGKSKPAATGVGFGGPVDWMLGQISCSHQIEGWSDFPLGDWLQSLTQAPVFVDNDANVAALGEALHGAGIGFNPVFYVTLGSGVGGGLVVDKKIYHGRKPGECEIGHLRLDRKGTILELRCSGWAVDAKVRQAINKNPDSVLGKLAGASQGGEAGFLVPALERGDSTACQILKETAEDLVFGLSHVVHLFHPEVIVLGGGLSLIGKPLKIAIEDALHLFVMEAFAPGLKVRLAKLREDAVPVGALELAIRALKPA